MARKKSAGSAVAKDRPVCVLKELPLHLQQPAAAMARRINPANGLKSGAAAKLALHPQEIAVLVNKYWGAKGVNLGVKFIDTTNTAVKNKILAYANKWNQYANIQFRESATGEIRLTLSGDGYWCYLGPDILQIPAGEPNMSLQGFSLSTPDSEYDRVVPHEFGHACGFPHEHERQEILSLLDVEKTVALFARLYGWDRATVMQQVFDPLNPTSIRASAPDTRSVMCYDFPASITKNGQAIPGGSGIDLLDGQFVATIYPKAITPPPPPPPVNGGGLPAENYQVSLSVDFAADGKAGTPTVSVSRRAK